MILEYKGIDFFYKDQGQGDVIVLLHGFLENCTMWTDLNQKLTKNNRVISVDLLGHGQTGCLGYVHTMEDMAEAVSYLLKHLKISRFTIIGHSMGGYVALALVEKQMEQINGLCLMNSSALADNAERKLNRDRAIVALKQNHKTFIRLAIANLFRPKNRTIFSKEIKQIRTEALKMPLQGIIAALEGMKIRKSRAFLLKSEKFKKLMIIGRKDPVLEYNTLIKQTQGAKIEIVEFPDGHMSHIENKKEFTYKIITIHRKIIAFERFLIFFLLS